MKEEERKEKEKLKKIEMGRKGGRQGGKLLTVGVDMGLIR